MLSEQMGYTLHLGVYEKRKEELKASCKSISWYEEYEIYGIDTEWEGEVVKVAKVKVKKLRLVKEEEENMGRRQYNYSSLWK